MVNGDPGAAANALSPLELLNAARRAVPAVDYALGAAGVAAAGAIITGLLGNGRATIIIVAAMLVAMVLLFVFARLVAAQNPAITMAGIVLLWVVTLFFCTFLVFTATAVAVAWPSAWAVVLGLVDKPPVSETPLQRLAQQINYADVATNKEAIASLVGMAMVSTKSQDRDEIVSVLKQKLKHPSTTDYDSLSRAVRRALLEGIIKIRNHDIRADFVDEPLNNMDLVAVDFRDVRAEGITFAESLLIGSDFRRSDLRGTDFSRSFLRNVKFHDAQMGAATFAEADWFNARGFTMDQLRSVEHKTLRTCPSGGDKKYSKKYFIEYADARYGVPYAGWPDEEQAETSRHWAEYMKPGGLCDFVRTVQ